MGIVAQPMDVTWDNLRGAQPKDLAYKTITDQLHGGGLLPGFKQNDPEKLSGTANAALAGLTPDQRGINALRDRATATGPSAWAGLAKQTQGLEEQQLRDKTAAQGASGAASAWDQMAMRGGASGGSRERIAMDSARNTANNMQNVAMQGNTARLGIDTADEQQKLDLLKGMPAAEAANLAPQLQRSQMLIGAQEGDINRQGQTDQFNINNMVGDTQSQNAFNTLKYQEAMKAWAADRTAQGELDVQKEKDKGSWICTEVDKLSPFSKDEWKLLNKFKKWCIRNDRKRAEFYFERAKDILPEMKAAGFEFETFRAPLKMILSKIEAGEMSFAADLYWDMFTSGRGCATDTRSAA